MQLLAVSSRPRAVDRPLAATRRLSPAVATLALAALALSGCGDPPTPPASLIAARVDLQGGDQQAGAPGRPLAQRLTVRVTRSDGRAVRGAEVEWFVIEGGGSIPSVSTSNSDGVASAEWVLGRDATAQRARAVVARLAPVEFTARANGFSLRCTPRSFQVDGSLRIIFCGATPLGDFSSTVTLATTEIPAGASLSFASSTLNPLSESDRITSAIFNVGALTPRGTSRLIVVGTSGSLSSADTISFTY